MSTEGSPRVSVVMPVYNSERYLGQAMCSVLEQSLGDLELLVVDDASTDGSRSVIAAMAQRDPRVVPVPLDRNEGPARARNLALSMARGQYVAFLDSDDSWEPQKLELQLEEMKRTGTSLCACSYWMRSRDSYVPDRDRVFHVPERISYEDLMRTSYFSCSTLVAERHLIPPDPFDPSLVHEDFGAWLKIMRSGEVACGIDKPLATYYVRRASRSSNKLRSAAGRWQALARCTDEPLPKRVRLFLGYALGSLRKYGRLHG